MNRDEKRSDRIFMVIAAVYLALCALAVTLDVCGQEPYVNVEIIAPEKMTEVFLPAEELVNINTADLEELMTLDGIGEATARKIIDYREKNNGFLTVDELMEVNGIGKAKLEKLRERITVETPEIS